jgi:putative hydrolase of the HAD superfamily
MRGIVFDLDETLVDRKGSLNAYAQELYSDFRTSTDMPLAEFVDEFHRLDGNGRVPRDAFFDLLASDVFLNVPARRIGEHFEANAWLTPRLFTGIPELLQSLRELHWRIGVITNGGVQSQSQKLENSGLASLVDYSVISGAFGAKKPDPTIFEHLLVRLGINSNTSWFIGDDPRSDIWGARQVGFRTIWVERYSPWPDDLSRCYDASVKDTAQSFKVVTSAA